MQSIFFTNNKKQITNNLVLFVLCYLLFVGILLRKIPLVVASEKGRAQTQNARREGQTFPDWDSSF